MPTPDDDLQKTLFGEIIFDVEYTKTKRVPGRILDEANFNNAKKCEISNVLNNNLYIGFTCNALKVRLNILKKQN